MKEIFKNTLLKLDTLDSVAFIDRDRGQLEGYNQRPEVKFPCALIKVNIPRRENLNAMIQRATCQIQIRVAFEKLIDQNNLNASQRLEKALEYYDTIEEIESLFQGLKLGKTEKWECTSIIDEDRADFDVVRITFATGFVKEYL